MTDEGYIKYQYHWKKLPIEVPTDVLDELNHYRHELIQLGMIGKIPNGPGFGNISVRKSNQSFYISGSDTGSLAILTHEQMALVTACNIQQNTVHFTGTIPASSESMSHGAIYMECPKVKAIIHIHHQGLWEQFINRLPTTSEAITYGTPEMAMELMRISEANPTKGIVVLAGHADGLISYGESLKSAFMQLQA
jgi:L-ribulose-5-phosphate 4-epimerase